MSDRSRSVYASVPFKFIVDCEPLYIHADLVSLHSKPLDRMMNGHMAEAQKGFTTLGDVDEGTFVRFIEWAHQGYYTAAESTTLVEDDSDTAGSRTEDEHDEISVQRMRKRSLDDNAPSPLDPIPVAEPPFSFEVHEISETWGNFGGSSKKSKSKKKISCPDSPTPRTAREDLMQSFITRRPVEHKNAIEIPPSRRNQSSAEVYSDVFLSNARLYVFAEKYDIQPLKMLALDELHATLAIFTLYTERTGDVIDLLRYVYTNTKESREGVEDMRILVTQYVGYEMDTLMQDPEFRNIIVEDGGDFLDDFMTMVARRIS